MSVSVAGVVGIAGVAVAGAGAYMSNANAKAAARDARDANGNALPMSASQLEWEKSKHAETMETIGGLEDIFGPVRENLGNYYKNMTPERQQLIGKEALEKQYDRSTQQLDATFSNNGMYNSGQAMSARMALEDQREVSMGQNQQNAMNDYNQQQTQWLAQGTNEMNALRGIATQQQGMVGNQSRQGANMMQQGGQFQAGIGMQQAQGWGQMASGGLQVAGYAMGGGFGGQSSLSGGGLAASGAGYGMNQGDISGPRRPDGGL